MGLGEPTPEKSPSRNVTLGGFPHSANVYRDLSGSCGGNVRYIIMLFEALPAELRHPH